MDFYVVMKRAGDRVSKRKIKTNKVSPSAFSTSFIREVQGRSPGFDSAGFFEGSIF
jgi:hypothetical protein